MTLSASTVVLFALLVPGLVFRIALYHLAQVRRPFFDRNTIYSVISVLLYSISVHFAVMAIAGLIEFGSSFTCLPIVFPHLVENGKILEIAWGSAGPATLLSFGIENPWVVITYFGILTASAWYLGRLSRSALERIPNAGDLSP